MTQAVETAAPAVALSTRAITIRRATRTDVEVHIYRGLEVDGVTIFRVAAYSEDEVRNALPCCRSGERVSIARVSPEWGTGMAEFEVRLTSDGR